MNPNQILGCHSEWNMVCPGGSDYQRMSQERGKLSWQRIKNISGIKIELDFDHPLLTPVPLFLKMLLRAHQKKSPQKKPYILLVAEKNTLDKVPENINIVQFLNRMQGVKAALTCPEMLEQREDEVIYRGRAATVIFLDMTNAVLLKIAEKKDIKPLMTGIKTGIVINPRGTEPLGAKGVFEMVTGKARARLTASTVKYTPWTRLFYPRTTTGPEGESIPDLVEWVRRHWQKIVLKPVSGYSGRGIFIGPRSESRDEDIQTALEVEPYIVQSFIPAGLWAEAYPWLDRDAKKVTLKKWQTDFRCLITDEGLIGFAARFGGIPTNVGTGGGNQGIAILKTKIPVKEAVDRINDAIIGLGYSAVREIQEETDQKGLELGHIYLKGPTPTTLRPRIITENHLTALQQYSANLWKDLLILENMWLDGKLDHVVELSESEAEMARMQPWRGSPALIASDGLFSFGAHL
jgi:hypothetical protein